MFPPTSNGGHGVMRWMPALAGNVPRRGLIRWAGEVLGHRTPRGSRGRTLPGRDGKAGYVVRPVPRNRQVVLDALTAAARRFPVHGWSSSTSGRRARDWPSHSRRCLGPAS
jgi:hypothetical protein